MLIQVVIDDAAIAQALEEVNEERKGLPPVTAKSLKKHIQEFLDGQAGDALDYALELIEGG